MRVFMKFVALLAVLVGMLLPVTVRAAEVFWTIENNTSQRVNFKIFAPARNNEWPGNDQVYFVEPYDSGMAALSCRQGEQICFGAWHEGDKSSGWGLVANRNNSCTQCCFTCDDGFQTSSGLND